MSNVRFCFREQIICSLFFSFVARIIKSHIILLKFALITHFGVLFLLLLFRYCRNGIAQTSLAKLLTIRIVSLVLFHFFFVYCWLSCQSLVWTSAKAKICTKLCITFVPFRSVCFSLRIENSILSSRERTQTHTSTLIWSQSMWTRHAGSK